MFGRVFSFMLLLICLWPNRIHAQEHKPALLRTIHTKPAITALDLQGNLYVCDAEGLITKYSATGEKLNSFSSPDGQHPSSIEIYQASNLLVYYSATQSYLYLDQNFRPFNSLELPSETFATHLTQVQGQQVWIADNFARLIRKYDLNRRQIISEISYYDLEQEGSFSIRSLKSYQNRIYIQSEKRGIYVMDNFGLLMKKLDVPALPYHFKDQSLYYPEKQHIQVRHLYRQTSRQIELAAKVEILDVLLSEKFVYIFQKDRFDIYPLTDISKN